MRAKTLQISLFGCCIVKVSGEDGPEITGSKHRALLVLLATAPMGRRSRAFLQETLWGDACYDGGRQSLRRALSDLRRIMGDSFSEFVETRQADITLDMSKVEFLTAPKAKLLLVMP